MNNTASIQAKVAKTILEDRKQVFLGGKSYTVAPPTLGTLIRASEMISRMPGEIRTAKKREFQDILAAAKNYAALAQLLAVLILGSKKSREMAHSERAGWLFGRKKKAPETKEERLSREIMDNVSPRDIKDSIVTLLEGLQLEDFFITTTFLSGINVTKPTKEEVEKQATASGESSAGSQSTTT